MWISSKLSLLLLFTKGTYTHINSVEIKQDKGLLKTWLWYVLQIHPPETQQNLRVKWNMDFR